MTNPKILIKIPKKWQRLVALNRKKFSLPTNSQGDAKINNNYMSPVADNGHFVVYSADQRRFVFPISYLNNSKFGELLIMPEEEFGLPSYGPIMLPGDAVLLEYAVALIQECVSKDMERALLMSIASSRCSLYNSVNQEQSSEQLLVY